MGSGPPKKRRESQTKPSFLDERVCSGCDEVASAEMIPTSVAANIRKVGKIVGKEYCSWFEIQYLAKEVVKKVARKKYDCVLGIANGGIIPAKLIAEGLGLEAIQLLPVREKEVITSEMPQLDKRKRYLVVDDIHDTGATYGKVARAMKAYKCDYAFCMSRYEQNVGISGRILNHNRWIAFPWELNSSPS